MKKFISILVLCFIAATASPQTYLKASDKPEYEKYLKYCNTPVDRPFELNLRVDVRKINGLWADSLGNWYVSKTPKVYVFPIAENTLKIAEYQKLLTVKIYLPVRRREPSIADFYKNWKTNLIQEGLIDDRSGLSK